MQKKLQGFTLVEVLIAMVILVSIIGAVTLIESKNISFSSSGKYQTQANGLAAEGLNVIKQIADENKLNPGGVGTGDCTDPSDPDSCDPGYYYLDESVNPSELKLCGQCFDTDGKTPLPSIKPGYVVGECPKGNDVVSFQDYFCAKPSAVKEVNNKDFTRTIIIP